MSICYIWKVFSGDSSSPVVSVAQFIYLCLSSPKRLEGSWNINSHEEAEGISFILHSFIHSLVCLHSESGSTLWGRCHALLWTFRKAKPAISLSRQTTLPTGHTFPKKITIQRGKINANRTPFRVRKMTLSTAGDALSLRLGRKHEPGWMQFVSSLNVAK